MDEEFYRIRRVPPYVFAEVNAMKAAARARGEEIGRASCRERVLVAV